MQDDCSLFVDWFLGSSSLVNVVICIGSPLVLAGVRQGSCNYGANRHDYLIFSCIPGSYNPCLTAGRKMFLAIYDSLVGKVL